MTLKERLNKMTLKKLISETKNFDNNYGYNTKISVYITSIGNDGKRHTVIADAYSNKFLDRMAIISFEECTVAEFNTHKISDKEYIMTVFIDIDRQ